MVDPTRYYDLERYLFDDVRPRFASEGSLGAFDFFSMVIWKANRAKSKIAQLLRRKDPDKRQALEPIVRDLTRSLHAALDDEARLKLLMATWGFGLPMATAILTVLWPENFTAYDVRVCEQLEHFADLKNKTNFRQIWRGYCEYRQAVSAAVPGSQSLRDKDRYLWARSTALQLERDIARGFAVEADLSPRRGPDSQLSHRG